MSELDRFRYLPDDISDVNTHRPEIHVPSIPQPQLQEVSDDSAKLHEFDVLSDLVWRNIDQLQKEIPIPEHVLIPGRPITIENIPGVH